MGTPKRRSVDRFKAWFEEGMECLHDYPPRTKDADVCFRRILGKDSKHFLGNFGRLYVLHTPMTERSRPERLRLAKTMLTNAPQRPKGTMEQLAMRYAANTLAWELFSRNKSPAKLREALQYAEIGARHDPDFDGTLSPVTGTKAEILIALGRREEAYALTRKVLDKNPQYRDFLKIAKSAGYRRWATGQPTDKTPAIAALVGKDLASERNVAMLTAVDRMNENAKRAPLSRAVVDSLRMQRLRGDRKTTVPLPPSLKALLAYDARLTVNGRLVFERILGRTIRAGAVLPSTTMTAVFRASAAAKVYRDLKESAEADMPALIELLIASDQRVFIYVASKDNDGEYPILRWDDEPCIWICAGCLQDELCSLSNSAWGTKPRSAASRQRAAEKSVAKWLAREPKQRFYEDDD